jgi:hypothetical protein
MSASEEMARFSAVRTTRPSGPTSAKLYRGSVEENESSRPSRS